MTETSQVMLHKQLTAIFRGSWRCPIYYRFLYFGSPLPDRCAVPGEKQAIVPPLARLLYRQDGRGAGGEGLIIEESIFIPTTGRSAPLD